TPRRDISLEFLSWKRFGHSPVNIDDIAGAFVQNGGQGIHPVGYIRWTDNLLEEIAVGVVLWKFIYGNSIGFRTTFRPFSFPDFTPYDHAIRIHRIDPYSVWSQFGCQKPAHMQLSRLVGAISCVIAAVHQSFFGSNVDDITSHFLNFKFGSGASRYQILTFD